MASNRASPHRYHPSERALRALQLTYELQILTDRDYGLILGSPGNRSEQLRKMVDADLLARIPSPYSTPGPTSHYYAVTPLAYPYLRQLPTGSRRPPAINLTRERIQAPGTPHLLAAGQFALACLYGLPADLASDWHGEPSARMTLAPGSHYRVGGTYIEPDGVLLTHSPTPVIFYECDNGSEHAPKWQAKIDRYARAATQGAHESRYGKAWPPLLVTVRSRESGAEVAGYVARFADEYPELRDWIIWLAIFDAVASPERIVEPAWLQVLVGADPAQPFGDELWSLPEILADRAEVQAQAVVVQAAPAAVPAPAFEFNPRLTFEDYIGVIDEEELERQDRAAGIGLDAADTAARQRAEAAASEQRQRAETMRLAQEEQQRLIEASEPARALERERERQALRERRQREEQERAAQDREDMLLLAAIVVGVLVAGVVLYFGVPAWVNYWWHIDPGLPAVWSDPNGVLPYQLVGTLGHGSFFVLIAPAVLGLALLLGWWRRRYSGW